MLPRFLADGGPMIWVILAASAVAVAVFVVLANWVLYVVADVVAGLSK